MNRNDAEQIALSVSVVRADWLKSSLMTMLGNLPAHIRNRTARDVHLALLWLAYDPKQQTPRLLREEGPWWDLARNPASPAPSVIVTRCGHNLVGAVCAECHPAERRGVPMPGDVRTQIAESVNAGRAAIAALDQKPAPSAHNPTEADAHA